MYTVFFQINKEIKNISTQHYGNAISMAYRGVYTHMADSAWVVDSKGSTVYVIACAKDGSIQERTIP
jgi:hypothetical protein